LDVSVDSSRDADVGLDLEGFDGACVHLVSKCSWAKIRGTHLYDRVEIPSDHRS
jgi:hypothetical protein